MSLIVVGTIPFKPGELFEGPVVYSDGVLSVGGHVLPDCQGTAAMLMAALAATEAKGASEPYAVLGGDIGGGDGTRVAYSSLEHAIMVLLASRVEQNCESEPIVIAFHYVQPVMSLMKRALEVVDALVPEALLVADAGGMYAARAAGLSHRFEIMTPDVGEIGFLAEPDATHPAYVANYLFGQEAFDPDRLIAEAFAIGTASRVLVVKGSTDRIAANGIVVDRVFEPNIPALEAIGGTGDTVTGLIAGLMSAGTCTEDAARIALRANRLAAQKADVQPYSAVREMITAFPGILTTPQMF